MDGYGPASYGEGIADTYDEWYGDRPDTDAAVDALLSLAQRTGGRVLELGVGSGRLALPLAAKGIDIWGIDASPAMVDRLRGKPGGDALPVALGGMAAVDLTSLPGAEGAHFGLVFAAVNTFF